MSFLYAKIYKIMYYTFMRENVYIILNKRKSMLIVSILNGFLRCVFLIGSLTRVMAH